MAAKFRNLCDVAHAPRLAALAVLTLILAGCSVFSPATPQALPTVILGEPATSSQASAGETNGPAAPQATSSGVTASGKVAPVQEVQMAFATGGLVRAVNAAVGETVEAGQVLISLDYRDAQMAIALAQADLAVAQASYDLVNSSDPLKAQASRAAAALALLQAQNAVAELERSAPLVTAQAQAALANAQKALDDAKRKQVNMSAPRANQTTIDAAQAYYEVKESDLKDAKETYDEVAGLSADDPERAQALLKLNDAQKERDKALITLNWYLGYNSELDIALADTQFALAQAQLASAEEKWAQVKDGPAKEELALAQARVASAQAQLDLANAPSPAPEQVALAQAQVDAAHARLEAAQAQLTKLTLTAPINGVAATVNVQPGEWVTPGAPVLRLVTLDQLCVETTDLSERDVPKVQVGQEVTVVVKALNEEINGRVTFIAPLADTLGGDVVYKATIALETIPAGLRASMSVTVEFR